MRRNFVLRAVVGTARAARAHLLVERLELFLQQVDLALLARHGEVQRLEQVVLEGDLDLQFGQAGFRLSARFFGTQTRPSLRRLSLIRVSLD